MRNWITWPCIVLACLTLAVGCNKSETSATAQKKIRLAFITNNAADFWTICRAGCNKAAQENPDIDVDFQMLADASAAGQVRMIDDLLSRGVQGIALSPVDPTNETPKLNGDRQVGRRLLPTATRRRAIVPVTSAPTTLMPASRRAN